MSFFVSFRLCDLVPTVQATTSGSFVPQTDMIARRVAYLVANEYLGVNQGHPILDVSAAPRGAQVSGAGAARSRLNFQDQVPFGAQFVDARVEVWYKLPTAATTADDGELDEVESGCNSGDEEGKGEERRSTKPFDSCCC